VSRAANIFLRVLWGLSVAQVVLLTALPIVYADLARSPKREKVARPCLPPNCSNGHHIDMLPELVVTRAGAYLDSAPVSCSSATLAEPLDKIWKTMDEADEVLIVRAEDADMRCLESVWAAAEASGFQDVWLCPTTGYDCTGRRFGARANLW
jgi:hypothetical protein